MRQLLIIALMLSQIVVGDDIEKEKAMGYISDRGEVYFHFDISDKKELLSLTRIVSIDKVKKLKVYAYANKKEFELFLELKYNYTVLAPSGESIASKVNTATVETYSYNTYPTYENYVSMMNGFASTYPNLCQIVNIGTSVDGRAILFARISSNIGSEQDKPKVLYTSTMHGNETAGFIMLLRLVNYFLEGYGADTRLTNILNTTEIWINPLANPDGTYYGGNNTVWGARRYNANNVDLNRNFPDPVAGDHPDGQSWQPETQAFMNFASTHRFVLGANFHGGDEVVSYPWDDRSPNTPHADTDWWVLISRKYVDEVHTNSSNGYMTDFDNGITNGYDWYPLYGGRQDFMNYYHHCRELTIELSSSYIVPEASLETIWNYNRGSLIGFIENVHDGLKGKIYDGETSTPMVGEVLIPLHDNNQSQVYSDAVFGSYYRPLYQGAYGITVNATGFNSEIFNVSIYNEACTDYSIALPRVCNVDKTIASNLNVNNGYYAFKTTRNITASSIIANNTSVNFSAEQTITLAPGFSVEQGSCFSAGITSTGYAKRNYDTSVNDKIIVQSDSSGADITSAEELKDPLIVYPNPFNPTVIIKFKLIKDIEPSNARLDIFSLSGQLIRTYSIKLSCSGIYSFTWNAKDITNMKVSAGVYLARLNLKGRVLKTKLTYVM